MVDKKSGSMTVFWQKGGVPLSIIIIMGVLFKEF